MAARRAGLCEFQHIGHRTARLLWPISGTLRPYGQQHDWHFVLGQCELAGHCFGIEADHRRRTEAQRASCIDHRRRAEGAGAYCLVAPALRVLHIQIACGNLPIRHRLCRHDARLHQWCQALWYYGGIGQLAADDEGNGCFGDRGLMPSNRMQPSLCFRRTYGDEAPVLQVEGRRRGGADSHQLADLVVAQGGSRVVVLGGAAAQDAFDDGVGHRDSVAHGDSCGWDRLKCRSVFAGGACALLTSALPSRPSWTVPAGCVHQWACVAQGRTRMIVFPLRRLVGFKAATASSRVETLPMFVRSRPSRTRWTISLSWVRSDSTTKSTARPSTGRASAGPTMDTSVPPVRIRSAERFPMSPPMPSSTRSTSPTSSRASLSRSTNSFAPKSSTV